MSGCQRCSRPTSNRLCDQCLLEDYYGTPDDVDESGDDEDDPSLVTDGGRSIQDRAQQVRDARDDGECDRCGTDTDRTTIDGTFRCRRCQRQVAKQNQNSSREEGQDALDDYVADGGQVLEQDVDEDDEDDPDDPDADAGAAAVIADGGTCSNVGGEN